MVYLSGPYAVTETCGFSLHALAWDPLAPTTENLIYWWSCATLNAAYDCRRLANFGPQAGRPRGSEQPWRGLDPEERHGQLGVGPDRRRQPAARGELQLHPAGDPEFGLGHGHGVMDC